MRNKKYWKGIAAIILSSAIIFPGAMAYASDEAVVGTVLEETEEEEAELLSEEADSEENGSEEDGSKENDSEENDSEEDGSEENNSEESDSEESDSEDTDGEEEDETGETDSGTEEDGFDEEDAPEQKTEFIFENEEVKITAKAAPEAELPGNTEMKAVKLLEGSPEYEAAKLASAAQLETDETAVYTFYDVTFEADGEKLEPEKGTVVIKMVFKNILVDETAAKQRVVHLEDTENGTVVNDVTASGSDGNSMSSVNFEF